MLFPDPDRLAVQAEEPACGRERGAPASADRLQRKVRGRVRLTNSDRLQAEPTGCRAAKRHHNTAEFPPPQRSTFWQRTILLSAGLLASFCKRSARGLSARWF